ncbi:hypothetical protein UFOVP244_118 [uncultured Caudovirales phage]|uniref:Uncharacterized protein n=1 Tax=uncultured Caudovirales phage TaxID=2100421 RepID=A0A6J7WYV3_9CAUD|nr:hypothetical protein UFOVP244_118 [uncultured Caudovirales phage]
MIIRNLLTLALSSLLLVSCGAKSGTDAAGLSDPKEVARAALPSAAMSNSILLNTAEELPVCDEAHKSQLAYIASTKQFQVCDKGTWAVVDVKGQAGDRGEKGDKGDQGVPGGAPIMPGDIIPPGSITLSLFGKKLAIDNDLLSWSCNQYAVNFFVNAQASCRGVDTKAEYQSPTSTKWTIASPGGEINLVASEYNEKLTMNGESYFCLMVSGAGLYTDNGAPLSSSVLFLSKTPASRVADLVPANIVGVGGYYSDFCTALDQ